VQPLFEYRRSFGGFFTRVLELEGTGPALVLLHGWADSADTWRPVLERLGRAERRAVAVDLPGFGAADRLDGDGTVLGQLDRFAADVATYAGDGASPVVVGNSLGGAVGLRLAARCEAGLAGVAAIAPAGLDMPRWFALVERDPFLNRLLAMPAPVPEVVVRGLVGRAYRLLAFADPAKASGELVAAFTSHHRDRAAVRRYLATARRMLPELDIAAELASIRCPVLLVWGDRDRMVSHRGAELVAAVLPSTRVEVLPGVGHCPQLEATERVVELLLGFASSRSRASGARRVRGRAGHGRARRGERSPGRPGAELGGEDRQRDRQAADQQHGAGAEGEGGDGGDVHRSAGKLDQPVGEQQDLDAVARGGERDDPRAALRGHHQQDCGDGHG
jgi:pimeloyl-ACP methyl ester carboxylesterase